MQVSVIVPVYNAEKFLPRCLDTVIGQTLKDIECICVYNDSEDQSYDILEKYHKTDSRVKLVYDGEPRGLSEARNIGMYHAQGEYIFFLDADDWIEQDALSELFSCAKKDDLDVVYFEGKAFFENEEAENELQYCPIRSGKYDGICTGEELFDKFYRNADHRVVSWGAFYRRKFLKENHLAFYKNIVAEDNLFYVQVILLAERVKCLPKIFYNYYRHMSSLTGMVEKRFLDYVRSLIIVYEQIYQLYRSDAYTCKEAIRDYLDSIYFLAVDCLRKVLKDGDLPKIKLDNAQQELAFYMMASSICGYGCRRFYWDDIEKIKRKKIIVYGAGIIARRVIKVLSNYEIDRFYIAVSKLSIEEQYLCGCRVYTINDLLMWREDAVVLIAVSSKYQKEILENLANLGFNDWLLCN